MNRLAASVGVFAVLLAIPIAISEIPRYRLLYGPRDSLLRPHAFAPDEYIHLEPDVVNAFLGRPVIISLVLNKTPATAQGKIDSDDIFVKNDRLKDDDIVASKVNIRQKYVRGYLEISEEEAKKEIVLDQTLNHKDNIHGLQRWEWAVTPKVLRDIRINLFLKTSSDSRQEKDTHPIGNIQATLHVGAEGIDYWLYEINRIQPLQAFLYAILSGIGGVLAYFGLGFVGRAQRPNRENHTP